MFPDQFPKVGNITIFTKNQIWQGQQSLMRHLEPCLRMTEVLAEVLAEVRQPARARGRTGPPNFIVEMIGISQKKSILEMKK